MLLKFLFISLKPMRIKVSLCSETNSLLRASVHLYNSENQIWDLVMSQN